MLPKKQIFSRAAQIFLLQLFALATLVAFGAGCATDRAPTASAVDQIESAAKRGRGQGKAKTKKTKKKTKKTNNTAASSDGTGRPLKTATASGTFSPDRSGSLKVNFANNYGSWTDLRLSKARFEVQAGAIDAVHEITMDVTTGYVLEDISVAFSPDGLTFVPPGTLTLTVWWDCENCLSDEQLVMLDALAQHIHPEGTVTEYGFDSSRQGNAFLIVTIDVPGFSRYLIRRSR